ncbi:MAG: hypothetical protein QXF12_06050 [Candidatus Aenigmatarchaeota archaeon]
MRIIRRHRVKKYKFFSDKSGNFIEGTTSETISEIIEDLKRGKGGLIKKLKEILPDNGEVMTNVTQKVIEKITEQVVETVDDNMDKEKSPESSKKNGKEGNSSKIYVNTRNLRRKRIKSKKYANKEINYKYKNYAKGPLAGLIKDMGINGAAKAITSAITSGLSAITTIPYIGPVIENLGEAVITPTMMAVPGSLLIYTLVKKELIEPSKFDHGVKEVENILKSVEDQNTGCIKIKDVKEISEKITSLFISGKNSPIRKILNWVKDEMIKSKKAKNEQEAYMKISEALVS